MTSSCQTNKKESAKNDPTLIPVNGAVNFASLADKSKPSPFATQTAAVISHSDKNASSPFAVANQPVIKPSVPNKDKKAALFSPTPNFNVSLGAAASKPFPTEQTGGGFRFGSALNKPNPTGGFGSFGSFGSFGQKNDPVRPTGKAGNPANNPKKQNGEHVRKETPVARPTKTLSGQSGKPAVSRSGSEPSQSKPSQSTSRPITTSTSQQYPQAKAQPISSITNASTTSVKTTSSPEKSIPSSSANTSTTTIPLASKTVASSSNKNFSSSFIMEGLVDTKNQASTVPAPTPSLITAAETASSFVSLVEEMADKASDQPQKSENALTANPASNKETTDRLASNETNLKQQGSAFSFLNDGSKSTLSEKPPFKFKLDNESLQKSAFSFINQTANSPTLSNSFDFSATSINLSDMFAFGSPTAPETFSSSTIHTEKDSETKLLSDNTAWRTFQDTKQKEFNIIQGLYTKEFQMQDMIKQLKEKMAQIDKEKTNAIQSEDYTQAQKLILQYDSMQHSLQLFHDGHLSMLQTNIRTSWQRMASLLEKESTLAERVEESTRQVKQDKHRYLERLEADHERLHRAKAEDLEKQRAEIDKLKSEVALDNDMIQQNETDLNERMNETVIEETEKLVVLESRSKTLKAELESLRQKLKELESEEKAVDSEIHLLKSEVKVKLAPFETEQMELEDEKTSVEQHQTDIKEKEAKCDEDDATINKDMTRIREVKERGEKDISNYDKHIGYLTLRQKMSKTECTQLNTLITQKMQGLEKTVTRQKQQIKESRTTIARKNSEIKLIQNKLYQDEQSKIDLDESITSNKTQAKSLARRKQLALQNGHFTSAEALSLQIKGLESSLIQLEEEYNRMGDTTPDCKRLQQERENLSVLEKQLVVLEKTCGSELKTVLKSLVKSLKKTLQQLCQQPSIENKDEDMLKSLIKSELTFLQSKLNSGNSKKELLSYF